MAKKLYNRVFSSKEVVRLRGKLGSETCLIIPNMAQNFRFFRTFGYQPYSQVNEIKLIWYQFNLITYLIQSVLMPIFNFSVSGLSEGFLGGKTHQKFLLFREGVLEKYLC